MSIKVLLDTDIGTDIDDAVCTAYLLAHPECDLLGVTHWKEQANGPHEVALHVNPEAFFEHFFGTLA